MLERIRRAFAPPAPHREERRWRETDFVARLEELIDERRGEDALDFLLAELEGLAGSTLHRREKLNHLLYAGHIVEAHTSAKHGPDKLGRKLRLLQKRLKEVGAAPEGTFLDFGCGRHDPLGLATVAYCNGFRRAVACDLEPVRNPAYSAISMHRILLDLFRFPDRYRLPGGERKNFRRRLKRISPTPFARRDFAKGLEELEGKVDYRLAELTTLDIDDEELGLVISMAVLEHVEAPADIYEWLYRKTRPGSVQFHYIDLADHRSYQTGSKYNAWSFLTEQAEADNHNRLRAHEHLDLIRAAGFELCQENKVTQEIPAETRERLVAPWRDLPREELETIGLRVLLRRPA